MGSYTGEDLLQELGLTLATTITKYRSKEVAKKNQSQMVARDQESKVIAVFQNHTQDNKEDHGYVRDVEEHSIKGAVFTV